MLGKWYMRPTDKPNLPSSTKDVILSMSSLDFMTTGMPMGRVY